MRILCTNDDGLSATGIRVMASAARHFGQVTIVAPDREQSAASHSLTLHRPLRAKRYENDTLTVDGTPTDCVILAINELLENRPDICLSGVNHGPNLGEDVLYSGTVAAAMEATVVGILSVAISYIGDDFDDMEAWEPIIVELINNLLNQGTIPDNTLFNVNLPMVTPSDVRGIRVTNLGNRTYKDSLTRAPDPSGKEYYWIGGGEIICKNDPNSDFRAVQDGYISVTPLHLDMTNYRFLEEMRGWQLNL